MAVLIASCSALIVFFFNDTATTEIYTLSLHDALPISIAVRVVDIDAVGHAVVDPHVELEDRKSTRLNSSHQAISYAVFCLKKKMQRGQAPLSFEKEWGLTRPDSVSDTDTKFKAHSPAWGRDCQKLALKAVVVFFLKDPGPPKLNSLPLRHLLRF